MCKCNIRKVSAAVPITSKCKYIHTHTHTNRSTDAIKFNATRVQWNAFILPLRINFLPWCNSSTLARNASFLKSNHTQWHTTVGKTPLDKGSARHWHLYLTTHNTQKRQTSMPPAWFEPQSQQASALDRSATGIRATYNNSCKSENLSCIVTTNILTQPKYTQLQPIRWAGIA